MEDYVQGTLRKELYIAPFVERFGKVLLMNFASTLNNLLKHCISADFLLMEGFVQGALRNELHIAPFAEHFKTATLGKSY